MPIFNISGVRNVEYQHFGISVFQNADLRHLGTSVVRYADFGTSVFQKTEIPISGNNKNIHKYNLHNNTAHAHVHNSTTIYKFNLLLLPV